MKKSANYLFLNQEFLLHIKICPILLSNSIHCSVAHWTKEKRKPRISL